MKSFNRKPKSPYARHGKRPFRYSDTYNEWKANALTNPSRAADLALEHARKFGYSLRPLPIMPDE